MEAAAAGTSRNAKTFYAVAKKEDMPPELLEKFLAYQAARAYTHPLYEREGQAYGKVPRGMTAIYQTPEFAKAGNLCVRVRALMRSHAHPHRSLLNPRPHFLHAPIAAAQLKALPQSLQRPPHHA